MVKGLVKTSLQKTTIVRPVLRPLPSHQRLLRFAHIHTCIFIIGVYVYCICMSKRMVTRHVVSQVENQHGEHILCGQSCTVEPL